MTYIDTVLGRRFFVSQPTFDIREIAHALSMQCRFGGHSRKFYSVAEHCVLVSRLCQDLIQCQTRTDGAFQTPWTAAFEGLMHDAHEAYFPDFPSPWKSLVPGYRAVEYKLEKSLRAKYGLSSVFNEGAKRADTLALFLEARELLPPGASDDWEVPDDSFRTLLRPVFESDLYRPEGWDWQTAKRKFLQRYSELSAALNARSPAA